MKNTIKELKYITANPFKRKGKKELEKNRFIFTLSIDLNWFKTDEAKQIMETAIKNNLLIENEETVKANYDLNQIELTLDYTPNQKTIQKIKQIQHTQQKPKNQKQKNNDFHKKLNLPKKQTQKEIQKIQKEMKGLIDKETAILILARQQGINIDKQIEKTLRKTLKT